MHNDETERIARLERKVDYLISYLGIDLAHIAEGVMPPGRQAGGGLGVAPADELASELADAALGPVYDALRRRKSLEAIKLYRQLTGAGLAEAKSAVDSMARDL
jgi:hypothetical protein